MDLSRLDDLPEVLSGDNNAPEFQQACQLLALFLFGVLRRAGFSPHDAETLAHDALTHIVLQISKFNSLGAGSFSAWCSKLALNRSKNWIRSQQHEGRRTIDPDWIDAHKTTPPDSDSDSRVSEEAKLAWEIFQSLGEQAYQLMLMRAIGDLSFEEIAEKLGISEANARQIYRRTRLKLAALIGADKAV